MVKRLVDDTIITEDTGSNRMYHNFSDTVRLRSDDKYQCVLEVYKEVTEPVTKTKRMGWVFNGYYPTSYSLLGSKQWRQNHYMQWENRGRKRIVLTDAGKEYIDVYKYIPDDLSNTLFTAMREHAEKVALEMNKEKFEKNEAFKAHIKARKKTKDEKHG